MASRLMNRIGLGALSLAASGLLFVAFPAVRPFGDFSSDPSVVAATFASDAWVISHALGTISFLLLPFGLFGLYSYLQRTRVKRRAFQGLILSWIGAGLTVVFFGAETFGLRVIGAEAVKHGSTDALAVANSFRFGPGLVFLLTGLVLVAIGAIVVAAAIWRSGTLPRWSGVFLAVGLTLYLPQLSLFVGIQPVRIADGILIAIGSFWVAQGLLTSRGQESAERAGPT